MKLGVYAYYIKKSYKADPSKKLQAHKKSYEADPSKKLQAQKKSYEADPSKKREAGINRYNADPSKKQKAAGTTSILFQRKLQMWCITTKTLRNVSAQCRIITDGAVHVCC